MTNKIPTYVQHMTKSIYTGTNECKDLSQNIRQEIWEILAELTNVELNSVLQHRKRILEIKMWGYVHPSCSNIHFWMMVLKQNIYANYGQWTHLSEKNTRRNRIMNRSIKIVLEMKLLKKCKIHNSNGTLFCLFKWVTSSTASNDTMNNEWRNKNSTEESSSHVLI